MLGPLAVEGLVEDGLSSCPSPDAEAHARCNKDTPPCEVSDTCFIMPAQEHLHAILVAHREPAFALQCCTGACGLVNQREACCCIEIPACAFDSA